MDLVLSSLLRVDWSVDPGLCLLGDGSGLCIGSVRGRLLFAGFAAVRRTVVRGWFAPHVCGEACWIRGLLRVVSCGCAAARVGGAGPSAVGAWQCFLLNVRDCLEE